jgi:putative oxidoreductase
MMDSLIHRVNELIARLSKRLEWVGPLVARLVVGTVFLLTGWAKLHGLEQVTSFFTDLGLPMPAFMAVLVATTELVGGALILLGLFTRIAAVALLTTMIVAILTAQLENINGIGALVGLIESAYAAFFIWLAVAGAGAASLDRLVSRAWASRVKATGGAPNETPAAAPRYS